MPAMMTPILFVLLAEAAYDNFPVKSINLASAPAVSFYSSPEVVGTHNLHDAHPVHGAATSDQGYVFVGKAVEADGSSVLVAFAIKLSSTGSVSWVWRSSATGVNDVANAVVQLPSGGDLIVVGYNMRLLYYPDS